MKTAKEILLENIDVLDEAYIDYVIDAMEEYAGQQLASFVSWHNADYPERYVPESQIGKYKLGLKD